MNLSLIATYQQLIREYQSNLLINNLSFPFAKVAEFQRAFLLQIPVVNKQDSRYLILQQINPEDVIELTIGSQSYQVTGSKNHLGFPFPVLSYPHKKFRQVAANSLWLYLRKI